MRMKRCDKMLSKLPRCNGIALKLLRFALVGGTSTLCFAGLAWFLVEKCGVGPKMATVLAYVALLIPNFAAHRWFTFASKNDPRTEWLRFALLHALNIALSVGGMAAVVDLIGLDYRWGIALSSVLVPLIVFLILNFWVFPQKPPGASSPMPRANDTSSDPGRHEQ